jgi:hypothetical protein
MSVCYVLEDKVVCTPQAGPEAAAPQAAAAPPNAPASPRPPGSARP